MIRLGGYRGTDLSADGYVISLRHNLREYLRRSPSERAQRRAPVDEEFYFSQSITQAVSNRCHFKCVFCERNDHLVRTEVGTYRPLRNATGLDGSELPDHYLWLAYEPENLILICIECSGRKGAAFPMLGAPAPYLAPIDEVRRRETPLLVDPYRSRPDRHFLFLADGRCHGLTPEGRVTASLLGLNNDTLVEQRRDDLAKMVADMHEIARGDETRASGLLNRTRQFAGARLVLTRRLLEGFELVGNTRARTAARLETTLGELHGSARERFFARLDQLVSEDHERSLSHQPYPPGDLIGRAARTTYAPEPRPNGGIAAIEFTRFKGLTALNLRLPKGRAKSSGAPCLMLLGENAVGKSSVLQGIALALIGEREVRRLGVTPSDLLQAQLGPRFDQLSPDPATVSLQFRLSGISAKLVVDPQRGALSGTGFPALVLGYGPHRYFDPRKSERRDADYARVQTLFSPTAALPFPSTWLSSLRSQEFNEVTQMLRMVLSLNDSDELVQDADGHMCVVIAGDLIPVERMSEGYRSIFAMVVDIARELMPRYRHLAQAEAIVLIDEIETHLHPRWKMRVMSALRRALPRVQFIVTTHDPLCLRGMDDGEVVVLQRDQLGRIVSLEQLPSSKGMRADQLLTSDYFGLSSTIDPEAELDLARYVAAVRDGEPDHVAKARHAMKQLILGDEAAEQVVQEALVRFLRERERPRGQLRTDVRQEAVNAVLEVLRGHRNSSPGEANGR
jgi:hypothetical protein